MSDPIEIEDLQDDMQTDFVQIGGNIFSNINYKLAFFMFFIGMILFSDVFIEGVLSKMSTDCVDGECPTTKGTIVQLLIFVLIMIVLDLLIKVKWL